jgi:hypothetical protein
LQKQAPDIPATKRRNIGVKGTGKMTTYWVGDGIVEASPRGVVPDHDKLDGNPVEQGKTILDSDDPPKIIICLLRPNRSSEAQKRTRSSSFSL